MLLRWRIGGSIPPYSSSEAASLSLNVMRALRAERRLRYPKRLLHPAPGTRLSVRSFCGAQAATARRTLDYMGAD